MLPLPPKCAIAIPTESPDRLEADKAHLFSGYLMRSLASAFMCLIVTAGHAQKPTVGPHVSFPVGFPIVSPIVSPITAPITSPTAPGSGASGAIYYVDSTIPDIHVASATPDCSNYNPTTFHCSGGSAVVYATIADINTIKFAPGSQILFRRGQIWREQLSDIVGSKGYSGLAGQPITIGAYGSVNSPLPIISGANIVASWAAQQVSAGGAAATVYVAPYVTIHGAGNSHSSVLYANAPNQVFVDGIRLTQNTSGYTSLAAGQWYLDTNNSNIWVRLIGDSNPGGHLIEASQRDYCIELYTASYISIVNLQTLNANNTGINLDNDDDDNVVISGVVSDSNFSEGIAILQSSNDTVKGSTVAYNGHDGISVFDAPNVLIDGNIIHDNDEVFNNSAVPCAGIKGGGPAQGNAIVQRNLIYSNGASSIAGPALVAGGIDFDTSGPGAIIRYNKIFSNTKDGIELDADFGDSVYGNVVFNNGRYGIYAFADGTLSMTNMQIYNNSVSSNQSGGVMLMGPAAGSAPGGCMNNIVVNNIVMSSLSGPNLAAWNGCENPGANGSGNVYSYNDFGPASSNFIRWGVNSKNQTLFESTYSAWEIAAGNCGKAGCSHSVQANPLFTNAPAGNFSLSASSPAIDAGMNLGPVYEGGLDAASTWPANVIIDDQNNYGGRWDIGAYMKTY